MKSDSRNARRQEAANHSFPDEQPNPTLLLTPTAAISWGKEYGKLLINGSTDILLFTRLGANILECLIKCAEFGEPSIEGYKIEFFSASPGSKLGKGRWMDFSQ